MRKNGAAPQDNISKSPIDVLTEQTVLECCGFMSRLLGACSHPQFPVQQKTFIYEYLKSTAGILEQSALGQERVRDRMSPPADAEGEATLFQH